MVFHCFPARLLDSKFTVPSERNIQYLMLKNLISSLPLKAER